MTIELNPEQEQLLQDAIRSGLAHTPDEALDQALDALRHRLTAMSPAETKSGDAIRRLAGLGKRHGLSLNGSSVKDLLRESRP